MSAAAGDDAEHERLEARAEHLKERIYVTFTALAVVLALREHHEAGGHVLAVFAITLAGTVLAVFIADAISHLVVHAALPPRAELRHVARVSFGAFGGLVVPTAFLVLGALGTWEPDRALRAATIALVATLAAVAWIAVRRVRLPWWQRVVVLTAELLLGFAVVALEVLAHG
jgi:hypothetical protein